MGFSSFFSGEILLELAPIMTNEVVHVHDQFFLSILRLEFEFSFDNSGAMAARKLSRLNVIGKIRERSPGLIIVLA
jgi:hypothetical protein